MISGIILAAGASKRMGTPKQTVKLGGKPMLQYAVDRFLESSLDEVILVLRTQMRWTPAPRKRLSVVRNPSSDEGISTSVKLGIESTNPRTEAVIIGLGDKPLLRTPTIERLIDASRLSNSDIIVPVFRKRRGNPILFRSSLFPDLRRLKGDVGAKVLVESKKYSVEEITVDDVGVLLDVDVPSDIQKAERMLSVGHALGKRETRK